jgi:cell division transport system ATP-binding protein
LGALGHGPLKLTGCWGKTALRIQGTVVIELENVGYNYGGGELLSDVSVKLAPGSFHFLTGPSGAGKTTLLKLCYGALTPTSGRVRAFNMDVQGIRWRICGVVSGWCIRTAGSWTTLR